MSDPVIDQFIAFDHEFNVLQETVPRVGEGSPLESFEIIFKHVELPAIGYFFLIVDSPYTSRSSVRKSTVVRDLPLELFKQYCVFTIVLIGFLRILVNGF